MFLLQRRRERRFAALAASASEHDGKSIAEQIAAAAPESVQAPIGELSTVQRCPRCDAEAALDAESCPACEASFLPEKPRLDWRWIGGAGAATAVLAVLLGLLIAPLIQARFSCSFTGRHGAATTQRCKALRWGSRDFSLLPPTIAKAPNKQVLVVSGWRYAALLSLAFLLGGLIVAWRVGSQPIKSSLLAFAIAWPAATLLATLLLGFAATRSGLVYAGGLHLLAGAGWFAAAVVGGKLGMRIGKRSEFDELQLG
jgi:hypothetical protein